MGINKEVFFEDVAQSLDSWVNALVDALDGKSPMPDWVDDPQPYLRIRDAIESAAVRSDDVKTVLAECLRGFAISVFTVIDGGGASAEQGRVFLVDDAGQSLGNCLHDDFAGYLIDTDRLR